MENKSKEYFQKTAEDWDKLRSGYFQEAVRDSAIAKAYLLPEMTVADIGAGTGFISAGLAPLVARLHIVDASAEMLAVARRNLKDFANIAYHQADGTSIPLKDGSMDAVFANMYLHHCPDPLAAIREMVRILKPGELPVPGQTCHPGQKQYRETGDQGDESDQWSDPDHHNKIPECRG